MTRSRFPQSRCQVRRRAAGSARLAIPSNEVGQRQKYMSHDASRCPCGNSNLRLSNAGLELELLQFAPDGRRQFQVASGFVADPEGAIRAGTIPVLSEAASVRFLVPGSARSTSRISRAELAIADCLIEAGDPPIITILEMS